MGRPSVSRIHQYLDFHLSPCSQSQLSCDWTVVLFCQCSISKRKKEKDVFERKTANHHQQLSFTCSLALFSQYLFTISFFIFLRTFFSSPSSPSTPPPPAKRAKEKNYHFSLQTESNNVLCNHVLEIMKKKQKKTQ